MMLYERQGGTWGPKLSYPYLGYPRLELWAHTATGAYNRGTDTPSTSVKYRTLSTEQPGTSDNTGWDCLLSSVL